ncbi:MAG: T9SS type A sorting domain-containing protein [Microscillaceae bacterium]|nr:T9SS type A sorting domain-containing protein [Microscillaceae bacterium]
MRNLFFWFVFLCCFVPKLPAQVRFEIVPNQTNYQEAASYKAWQKPRPKSGALSLPFLDDFSTYSGIPDTLLWENEGGTLVNNQMAIAPISLGAATFDGLDAQGNPYDFSDVVNDAIGLTDQLVSQILDLSIYTPADSLYLSFYWQREGRGEIPDEIDSLRLQFKDQAGDWATVWQQRGGEPTEAFGLQMVPLREAAYFFETFQFRFQAFGRQAGLYDVWHLDYIYLNASRFAQDFYPDEIAVSAAVNPFLRRYSAMPLNQYLANPGPETAAQFRTTLNNLSNPATIDAPSYRCVLREKNTDTELAELANTAAFIIPGDARDFEIMADIPLNLVLPVADSLVIEAEFIVSTGDNTSQIPPLDLRRNDTIRGQTVLKDYLAYDDGSAEYGAGLNQIFGQVAVLFELNTPDVLTDVQVHITKLERDLTGQTFNLVVWKSIGAPRDSVLYKINVPIRYAPTRDGYLSITEIRKLSNPSFEFEPIAIEGPFYVGWEQTTNDRVTFGYDRNLDASAQIFFNAGNEWLPFTAEPEERGSLMIRPVFGDEVVTELPESQETDFQVFPNPTKGRIYFKGKMPEKIELWQLTGRILQTHTLQVPYCDLGTVPPGVYFLRAYFSNQSRLTRRLVILPE